MFARFLELAIKPEKKMELLKTMKDEIHPILRKYNGFFDVLLLEVENEPTKFYTISLWREKLNAEKYEKENFRKVTSMLEPFLTMPVVVKLCKVDETITKKFTAVAA